MALAASALLLMSLDPEKDESAAAVRAVVAPAPWRTLLDPARLQLLQLTRALR
jgi:hypothetical protein